MAASTSPFIRAHEYMNYFPTYAPYCFKVVYACLDNDLKTAEELMSDTHFSAAELLECAINTKNTTTPKTFQYLLSRITPKEINETFIARNGVTHTLLTYFCYTVSIIELPARRLQYFKDKLELLVQYGADLNKEVNGKTGASYLVKQRNIWLVQLYMNLGGDFKKGYLLVNTINWTSEEQYNRTESSYPKPHISWNDSEMFRYLCFSGVDPNEIEPESGMNTLIAACSESNADRFNLLLRYYNQAFDLDINIKTPQGKTVMDWAVRQKNVYYVQHLEEYIEQQNASFKQIMYEAHVDAVKNNQTMVWGKCDRVLFDKIISPFLDLSP